MADTQQEKQQLSHNFLYLHPNENVATAHVLDASNYHSWSRSMLTTLNATNNIDFVLGIVVQPNNNNSKSASWYRCNSMVVFPKVDGSSY